MNLASRMEQLTKDLGEPIIFSEETRNRLSERIGLRSLEAAHVKGIPRVLHTFAPAPNEAVPPILAESAAAAAP